jgi:hypothetical protein
MNGPDRVVSSNARVVDKPSVNDLNAPIAIGGIDKSGIHRRATALLQFGCDMGGDRN